MLRITDDSKSSKSILTEHHGIKVDKKYILNLTKERKNVYKEVKKSCKVLHFSSDWTFDEVLTTIDALSPEDYPQLFIFIIDYKYFGFSTQPAYEIYFNVSDLKWHLNKKFGLGRPIIFQLIEEDKNVSKIYYKEETSDEFIECQQDNKGVKNFSSFLNSFLDYKFNKFEDVIQKDLLKYQNRSLILRFLRTLNLSDGFYENVLLKMASNGTKTDFLAALDSSFSYDGRILNCRSQKYISDVFEDCNDPEYNTSVLLKAVQNLNKEIIDYLITYGTHLIQQLPFDHQLRISTTAFDTNELDVLCDLLQIADYPFPKNFKLESISHEMLNKIINDRISLEAAIKNEDIHEIRKLIDDNSALKIFYNVNNKSALQQAVDTSNIKICVYLKLKNFHSTNPEENFEETEKEAMKYAAQQREKNITEGLLDDQISINTLCNRSLIHNKRITKEQEKEYRNKIRSWYEGINKIINGSEFLNVAASCKELKIIFDFESNTVENSSIAGPNELGSMYPISKWIFIGAKLSDNDNKVTKQREQQIKGVLAHELCHYDMRLVYENQENPYFEQDKVLKKIFEEIVKKIDKWSTEDSEDPDDECNGIISSVYKCYPRKDFHRELIARAVQILTEFDDDPDKSKYLQEKYKNLFTFWKIYVVSELQNHLLKNEKVATELLLQKVIKLNRTFELLITIQKHQNIDFCKPKTIMELMNEEFVIVLSNIPKLLFVDIINNLREKDGCLFDSRNLFVDPQKFKNEQIWDDFKNTCLQNQKLNIFIDCTHGIPIDVEQIFIYMEHNFIFVVSNKTHREELKKIAEEMKNPTLMNINYNWNDLTEESQNFLLQTKINFQNNSQISLMDLLNDEKPTGIEVQDSSQIIDEQMLNLLLENQEISINAKLGNELYEKYFELIYQPRLIKCQKLKNNHIMSENEFISEVSDKKFVLFSDKAGNGKSWTMKNISKLISDKNPTRLVAYVDLKQLIDQFRIQKSEPEFLTFMIDKILMSKTKFEEKIFQKLYKDGRICIFFDGFDEIAPDCAEFVEKLIQSFEFNGGNQLWIGTRDYFEVDLKEKLKLDVAYSLDEMTEEEGIDLIARSWVLKDLENDKDFPKSREDFDKCIKISPKYEFYLRKARQIIKKAMISRNNSIGLPLLFKMITEGFKDEDNIDDLQRSKTYFTFIKVLYKRWSKQKGSIRNEASIDSQKFEMNFYKFHQYHALLSLFPKLAAIFFPGCDGREWPEEEIVACGILTIKNGKIYFIHETFREYFVADFIAKFLRKSKIDEKIVELFVKVLTAEKFGAIRMFLNDMINDDSLLNKIQPQLQNYIEKFYKMTIFADFFTYNLKNLVDLVLGVLKNGNYEQVKEILNKNAKRIATDTTDSAIFHKFQEFMIDFLEVGDLMDLIIKQEVFQGIIESSMDIELFEEFVMKTEAKTDREFVRQALMLKSDANHNGNIFYFLSQSANLNARMVQKLLKIMNNFLTFTEVLELVSKYNTYIGHISKNRFEIMRKEIENYHSFQFFLKSIGEQRDLSEKNILHSGFIQAAWCVDIKVHKTIWKVLLKTFVDREELKNFILQKDEYGNNFIFNLVNRQENESIVEWTFKILKENFSNKHFEEILTSKGLRNMNLLQSAAFWSKNVKVHQFLWKTFREFFVTEYNFIDILTKVNDLNQNILHIATLNSSSEVFEFMIQKFKQLTSQNKIRIMLSNIDYKNQNLLLSATWWNKSLKFHETLWKTFLNYFEFSEILMFIKHTDKYGNNILLTAVKNNLQEIVELTWNKIKSILNHDEQIEYLVSNEDFKHNMLTAAYNNQIDPNVRNWIKKLLNQYKIGSDENKASTSAVEPKSIDETKEVKAKENKKPLKVIWRNKTNQNYYYIEINDKQLFSVCYKFIILKIKGEIIGYSLFKPKKIHIQDLISDTGCNLLIFAVNEQYYDIIESLLIHNFDIDHEDNQHRCAIDHAWINYKNTKEDDVKIEIEAVMLQLLSANSKLPNKILNFSFDEAPEKVKEFIRKCEELHKRVANDKFEKPEFENNKLRYIYDKYNESLLLYALKLCKVDFIKKFGSFLSIRHDEVYYELTRDPRTEFNSKYPEIPKPHIIMFKSKSEIYGKKYQNHKNWIYIDNIYKLLDKNDICSKVLKIAAENKMLRIFFVPNEKEKDVEQYEKQTIFTRKHIYISANLTLEDEIKSTLDDAPETAKTLIDELCRVVVSMLCLDNIEISEISTKDDRETNIQPLEETVRKVLSESQFDYFQKLNNGETIYILRILQAEDEVINFEYLPEPMQNQILKSKVDFQGVDVNFSDIIDGNRDVLTHLPSKLIRDILIRKMTIKIGDTLNMDSKYEIFDRNLVEYQPNTSDKELKTSILVDDFGTGKSTNFQHMSAKFKLELKSSWVCLIKLTIFSEFLQKYSNQNINIDKELIIRLSLEIINPETKLEEALFKNLFSNNKVILLVDDIDEIEPKLADFFIKVLGWIAAKSKNMLWISTCPVFLSKLEEHLRGNLYRFDPNYSPYQQKIITRFLKEFKNDDLIPDGQTSFISSLEDRKNGKHYSIMNCGMIRAIIETYVKDRAVFKEGTVNFYSIFEQIYTKQKNIFNKYIMDKPSNPFESFSIYKVQQVYALKSIFSNHHEVQLKDLAIMKHWKREERKWTKEMIGRRGFISFDGDDFHFIHYSYAEFFVAEYLISYVFSYDYSIRDDEFEKIFNIIRFMTQKYDDFEIICNFISGYSKSRVDSELHETMRDVIQDKKNIQNIQEDIKSSQNPFELKEFWLEIVKSYKDLSEHIQLLTGH